MDSIEPNAQQLTSNQFRARAEIVRSTADQMTRATMRRQLLRIAAEYEWLAERIEGICPPR
jgi:hypothetical protein